MADFHDYLAVGLVTTIQVLSGGEVNRVYAATLNSGRVVCRVNEKDELGRFKKEQWCMEQATTNGIPTPAIHAIGSTATISYMILDFVDGVRRDDMLPESKISTWETLGRYAAQFPSIKVQGFGEQMVRPGVFNNQWADFLEYNINSMTEDDILIRMNILSKPQAEQVKTLFIGLRNHDFQVGLCHGDLSLNNVVITTDSKAHLLDWGCAEANFIPYGELIGILENGGGDKGLKTEQKEFRAFLRGYGMNDDKFKKVWEQLKILWLLRRADKLRWAIDQKPDEIPNFTSHLKAVLELVNF